MEREHIHIHVEGLIEIGVLLNKIDSKLSLIQNQLNKMAQTLDDILADVTDEGTQIDSLSTLTKGIKAQLDAVLAGALTPEQQAKVDAIFSGIETNKAKVVAAINENTTPPPVTP